MTRQDLMNEVRAIIIYYEMKGWDWIDAVEYTLYKARR
jgi:hypothetical protein